MLQIAVWKNNVINRYGFWTICLPKIDISTRNLACNMLRHSSTNILCIFRFFMWILEKLCKKKYFFGPKQLFWENPRYQLQWTVNSMSFGSFYLHFTLNFYFLWFFKHLSIFYQKWHDIGSLKAVYFEKYSRKFSNILHKDVKMMYGKVS